uniref:glutathione transferase n=1 Tax=Acrobeloides nanus TaxID=290746 RepID=A0A914DSG4_9BILA
MVHYKLYYFPVKARGLAGTGDWEKAQVDAFVDFFKDISSELGPFSAILLGFSQADKEAAYKEHYLPVAERAFPILKKYLRDAGNGYLFKGGLTYADFILAEAFDLLAKGVPNFYEDHPEFKNHNQKVYSLPQLQKYLSARS